MTPAVVKPSKSQTNFTCVYDEVDRVKKVLFESWQPLYEDEDFYEQIADEWADEWEVVFTNNNYADDGVGSFA